MSNGGIQVVHPQFFKWFPDAAREKVITGDTFLRRDLFKPFMSRIKEQRLKNIVIVGGSHSGFSCAWMLLHGPATYNKNTAIRSSFQERVPGGPVRANQNCVECCTCG